MKIHGLNKSAVAIAVALAREGARANGQKVGYAVSRATKLAQGKLPAEPMPVEPVKVDLPSTTASQAGDLSISRPGEAMPSEPIKPMPPQDVSRVVTEGSRPLDSALDLAV